MKSKFILIFLIALFSISSYAQVDRSVMPKPGPAPEIKIGETESFTLENGLKVFVVENHKLPRVSFSLVLDLDPILEGENMGYISAAGQLLGTATSTKTKAQIDEEVDFIGASFNANSSGVYASSLKKHMPKLVKLMSDVILNPVFNKDELDKIKKQTISGLQAAKEDPKSIAQNVKSVLLYGKDHPYGEVETEKSVESITLDMCKDYYNTYFKPNVAYLAVVGDIDIDEAKDIVEENFSQWQKGEVPKHSYKNVNAPLARNVAIVDRPTSVQSVINIAYPIDLKKGADDVIAATVMNQILGGGMSGRLFLNLREDKAYTYGAYSRISSDMIVGSFGASCEARNAVTDSAIIEFMNEFNRIRNEKVTQNELDAAKNYLAGSFARSLESPQTVARFALNIERYNLPKDYYANYLKQLSSITIEDVQAVAKKYVKPDNAYVLVVGKSADISENLKQFTADGKLNYYDIYGNPVDPNAVKIPEGLTAEKVLDNYIAALGGREKIKTVNDRVNVLKGQIQGMDLTVTISQKLPNKFKMNLMAGPMQQIQVFNGEKGQASAMGQSKAIEGKELENMKIESMMFAEASYKELGVVAKLSGAEKLNEKEVYKVDVTYPTGKVKTKFFEAESGLLVKESSMIETPQGNFPQVVEYSNYKEVDGIMYPHTVKQQMGPQVISLEVNSITVNKGIDDSVFEIK